jgi:hypothetical protein
MKRDTLLPCKPCRDSPSGIFHTLPLAPASFPKCFTCIFHDTRYHCISTLVSLERRVKQTRRRNQLPPKPRLPYATTVV